MGVVWIFDQSRQESRQVFGTSPIEIQVREAPAVRIHHSLRHSPTVSDIVESESQAPIAAGAFKGAETASAIFEEQAVDERPRLLKGPKLKYPAIAFSRGVEGEVLLTLVLDAEGKVVDVKLSQGAGEGFDEAALAAARQFRFKPAQRQGKEVPVRIAWTVRFRLQG